MVEQDLSDLVWRGKHFMRRFHSRRPRNGTRLRPRAPHRHAKARYPEVRIARTLEEMLADKSIRLCVVATPNDTHYSYAKVCLEAGRDVVIDKPLTPTMAEAEELVVLPPIVAG